MIEMSNETKEKFTKGPWRALPSGTIYDAKDFHIAGTFFSKKNWESNAKLIAAAPDLYEANKPFESRLDHTDKNYGDDETVISIPMSVGQCRAILKALRKARGEE